MRALIIDYGVETVWAAVLMSLFLTMPARAQDMAWHFETGIIDCEPAHWGCFATT